MQDNNNNSTSYEEFDFEKAYNASFKNLEENTVIKTKVIDINEEIVFLDFGYKSEAKVPVAEFETMPSIGDEIEVYLLRLEGRNGQPLVSKKMIDKIKDKKEIEKKFRDRESIKGKVVEIVKDGCIVEYKSVKGFIPVSLFDVSSEVNLSNFLSKEIEFYIERYNFKREEYSSASQKKFGRHEDEFVGNRKRFILDESNVSRKKFFEERNEGDVVKGRVKKIMDYGAFINISGIDALLRIKDISWDRISKVEDILKNGQEIEVVILNINKETKKITVGLKQLQEDPWNKFIDQYKIDDITTGSVVSLTTYGAFVKIFEGVEGLLHISDMSWLKKVNNPSELVKVGQKLELKIINIDNKNRKVSLSLKHLLENPWDSVEKKYKVGTRVKGKVKTITTFGFFIEIEEGLDALLHIDDISWTETIKNPHNLYSEGDEIEAVIIQCDSNKEKIKVGIKQLKDDPWKIVKDNYKTGDIISCKIEKVDLEKGLTVEITEGVSSFIPLNHIGMGRKQDLIDLLRNNFNVDDEVKAIITNFDVKKRNIALSIKEYLKKMENEKVKNFLHDDKEDSQYTLGDALKIKDDESSDQ